MIERSREEICFNLLCDVFGGEYVGMAMKGLEDASETDKAFITKLFYGVLDKNVELEYVISQLVSKKPKTPVFILLKMGAYQIRYMSVPPYAVVDKTVALTKKTGKGALSGFVNATLRKCGEVKLPNRGETDDDKFLSLKFSVPLWIIKKMMRRYGFDFVSEFYEALSEKRTHIRRNTRLIEKEKFEKKLGEFDASPLGYYVKADVMKKLFRNEYTAQSLSSMIAANCYIAGLLNPEKIIDICGAPGGKSVYLSEFVKGEIICCDVYPVRVDLIKKYAGRMRADNVVPYLSDATAICPEFIGKFDIVICDVPCSGIGVASGKPDIYLNRKPEDISTFAATQKSILNNAARYVKKGGRLCYSTCTVFKEENEEVINWFLGQNSEFVLEKIPCNLVDDNNGMVNIFPQKYGSDGFFVARMVRSV